MICLSCPPAILEHDSSLFVLKPESAVKHKLTNYKWPILLHVSSPVATMAEAESNSLIRRDGCGESAELHMRGLVRVVHSV